LFLKYEVVYSVMIVKSELNMEYSKSELNEVILSNTYPQE